MLFHPQVPLWFETSAFRPNFVLPSFPAFLPYYILFPGMVLTRRQFIKRKDQIQIRVVLRGRRGKIPGLRCAHNRIHSRRVILGIARTPCDLGLLDLAELVNLYLDHAGKIAPCRGCEAPVRPDIT